MVAFGSEGLAYGTAGVNLVRAVNEHDHEMRSSPPAQDLVIPCAVLRDWFRSARARALGLAVVGLLVSAACPGCTVSRPRGAEHLSALAAGDRHFGHGRLDDAEQAYAEAAETAERRVDRDEAMYRRARVLMRQERWAEAVAVLDELEAFRPVSRRTARALFDASRIRLDELGDEAAAMAGFERIVREYPDRGNGARALFFLIRPFREADDPEGALALLDRFYAEVGATTLGDDILRIKADLLLGQGDRAGARAALERLVREHPYPEGHRWDDALISLAEMDVEDGRPEDAIARLREIVSKDDTTTVLASYTLPTFPRVQLRIAEIYRDELADYEAADREFRFMFDHFHRSSLRDDALYERGAMWVDAGEVDRGCEILRQVVESFEVGHARRSAEDRLESDCTSREAPAEQSASTAPAASP
jgi:tetratricopeptide (TPR) repeat protein